MIEINGTTLVFALSFLVFVFLLDQVLWKPIIKVKAQRADDLNNELNNASQAEAKTKTIINQVNSEIEAIKKSEQLAIEKLFADSKAEADSQTAKLKAELEAYKQKSFAELDSESSSLESEIHQQAQELAKSILAKISPSPEGARV